MKYQYKRKFCYFQWKQHILIDIIILSRLHSKDFFTPSSISKKKKETIPNFQHHVENLENAYKDFQGVFEIKI